MPLTADQQLTVDGMHAAADQCFLHLAQLMRAITHQRMRTEDAVALIATHRQLADGTLSRTEAELEAIELLAKCQAAIISYQDAQSAVCHAMRTAGSRR